MKSKYFTRPTIYVSHAIRGTNGDMIGNCKKAISGLKKVQALFPEVDFYVPAHGDLALQILYNNGKVTEHDILQADVEILKNCHGYMFYKFDSSDGAEIERLAAMSVDFIDGDEHDINFDLDKANFTVVRNNIRPIVEKCIKRFRSQ